MSCQGRVRSKKTGRQRVLTQGRNGYVAIPFSEGGSQLTMNVHRLVAKAFLPNPDNLPVVMHLNDIRNDNRVSNLRWGTQSENLATVPRNARGWFVRA